MPQIRGMRGNVSHLPLAAPTLPSPQREANKVSLVVLFNVFREGKRPSAKIGERDMWRTTHLNGSHLKNPMSTK